MITELRSMGCALNKLIDRLEGQALAQATFTADISHELGNPINTFLLQAQLAGDPDGTPPRSRTPRCGLAARPPGG